MKTTRLLLGSPLLVLALNACADDMTNPTDARIGIESLRVLQVAPCQASGDGTFTEMVTTMASVLPAADADALLARYCDECNKRKFAVSLKR